MSEPSSPRPNEYQRRVSMWLIRAAIVLYGIFMPLIASLPGLASRHAHNSFLSHGGIKWFESTSFFIWLPILFGSLFIRYPKFAIIAAVIGFAFPTYGFAALAYSTDAQTPIAYLFLPIYSFPISLVGWIVGFELQRFSRRKTTTLGNDPRA